MKIYSGKNTYEEMYTLVNSSVYTCTHTYMLENKKPKENNIGQF